MNYFNNNQDKYKINKAIFLVLICGLFSATSIMAQQTELIDFDNGTFSAGDIVSEVEYSDGTVAIFGFNPAFPDQNAAMIFDSNNPTGGDFDLGTPNELFGGPGINLEGGNAQSNDTPLNNVLIVSEDLNSEEPDDATAEDISLSFRFSTLVTIVSLNMLDLDSGEAGLVLLDSAGNELFSDAIPETGCNGVAFVQLNISNVAQMNIMLNGSGAVDNIMFVSSQIGVPPPPPPPFNTDPIALDDQYSTEVNTDLEINEPGVLSNDIDLDGDALTIIAHDSTTVSGGSITLNPDGSFTYTPPVDFEGDDGFDYVIDDGNGGTDTATVTISVILGATNPVANDDIYTTDQNTELTVDAPGVLTNDTDPNGDPLTVVQFDNLGTNGGTVELNADGSFTYIPAVDSLGMDTFTYVVSDGTGNTDTATVFINIIDPSTGSDENSPPIAEDDEFMTDQDLELIIMDPNEGLLVNDSDPDGDSIAAIIVMNAITDQGGTISINADGTITYSPALGFVGIDTYEYTICDDGEPQLCDTAIISIEIKEIPVKIFNAFSPNGDGRNDTWIIEGITRFPNNLVQIFNRWGNLVFKISGYDNTVNVWEGQSNEGIVYGDNQVPDGAYFYIVDLGDGSKQLSGYVVIQR